MEEASHLLRLAPVGILFRYYVGTLPFVLGFLFFWVDMGCSGAAGARLVGESLGIAALYVWMKCWQAVFASNLRFFVEDAPRSPWSIRRILRLACIQSIAGPWSMILMLMALIVMLPFGWCYAFFHNMAVFGDGERELGVGIRKAWRQCSLWPAQNHIMILFFLLLAIFVYLNVCMGAYLVPKMLRTFLGIETIFSRDDFFFFNTTFLLAMAGVTYLCINPLIKASYVLRCFYGESLSSGRDLLSEWRRLHSLARQGTVLIVVVSTFMVFLPAGKIAASPEIQEHQQNLISARQSISADNLDRAISDVMEKLEYSWRFPHEKVEERRDDSGFMGQVLVSVKKWLQKVWGWVTAALEWLADWLGKPGPEEASQSNNLNLLGNVGLWLTVLLVALVVVALLLLRGLHLRKRPEEGKSGEEPTSAGITADLNDENTSADQLPEARWLALAKSLIDEGELRLALRAFYFATLAHLADRDLLTISRFKSNRDYDREIKRRAHSFPGLIDAFSKNVTTFERIWYGIHGVGQEMVRQFVNNYERIAADGQNR